MVGSPTQAQAGAQGQVRDRAQLHVRFEAVGLGLVSVEQHAVAVRIVAVELDVIDRVGERGGIQAQAVVPQAALHARFPGQDGLGIGGGEVGVEHGRAALDGRAAEAAGNLGVDAHVRRDLVHRAQIPARGGVGHLDVGAALVGDHASSSVRGLQQAGVLLVLGLAQAGGDGELVGEGVAQLSEAGPRGVLVAQAHPVVRVAGRTLQEPRTLVEVGGVAAVEVERTGLPLQCVVVMAGQAELLGPLVEVADAAHRLAIAPEVVS
ncbi:hypothetical protein G6F22_015927 [Rhizopus arrhizus]|nr:hypothetical protein G6F22_015927 [Rhizopus arrhizus]